MSNILLLLNIIIELVTIGETHGNVTFIYIKENCIIYRI